MTRVSLVTGGSRGIGFAVATSLLNRGDSVAITGTSAERVHEAANELANHAAADRVLPVVCDVREAPSVESAMRAIEGRFGGIDVLVNNAGVGVGAPIADLSEDEWHRIIDTNLTGVYHCCKAAIPRLRRRGGGWIINISSLASKNPFVGGAAYCASKAGLNAFSEALIQELRTTTFVELRVAGLGRHRVLRSNGHGRGGLATVTRRCRAGHSRFVVAPGTESAQPRRDSAVETAEIKVVRSMLLPDSTTTAR